MNADKKHYWNEKIDRRRDERKGSRNESGFQKGNFDAKSPDYSLPLDVYEHPEVQKAEAFFAEQRDHFLTNRALAALNKVQNNMRDELATFSTMSIADDDITRPFSMRKYVDEATRKGADLEKGVGWNIVKVVAGRYLDRADAVLVESRHVDHVRGSRHCPFGTIIPFDSLVSAREAIAILDAYHDGALPVREAIPDLYGFHGRVSFTSFGGCVTMTGLGSSKLLHEKINWTTGMPVWYESRLSSELATS
ncbi:hypothetical protein HOG48_03375 [Candidatus Peregrinibacteria bacterium]|jgi:hypothetical protein|nr:hypothetical protein [Candidatus Peregrinibacteria bacterium]